MSGWMRFQSWPEGEQMRSPPNVETSPQARFDVRGVWRRLEGTKAHPYGHAFAAAGVTGRAGGMVNDGNPTSITQETRVTTCVFCSGGGVSPEHVLQFGCSKRRVEGLRKGSRTRKTRDNTCSSCSGGGWLQRWGGEVRGRGRGLQNTTNTCCDAFFMFWRWGSL